MRFAQFVVFGALALMFATPQVKAQDTPAATPQEKVGRNFGSYNCQPTFPCGADGMDYVALGNSCAATGLGLSADFSGATFDSGDCMTVQGGETGKQSSAAVCCITPLQSQDGICKMSCSLMFYQ